jgi:hypothetical protein
MSTNFMILGATDQKLWVFEVFRRSLGRVGIVGLQNTINLYWQRRTRRIAFA